MRLRSSARLAAALCSILALVAPALFADGALWRAERSEVRVVCPLTVGGSFEARTAALSGTLVLASAEPVALNGALAVDLRTLDTGIDLRSEHMRDGYLEVGKGEGFDSAVLSEIRLAASESELPKRTNFTAILSLHGVKRAIAGEAEVRREAARVHVEAAFPVTLADFAIAKPQYLGVGVKSEVQVKVSLNVVASEAQ